MYDACTKAFPDSDAAILSAAVADFAAEEVSPTKIKRGADGLTLRLRPTHDIARALGKMKRDGQRLVAFALETNDEESNAKRKLERKNADFIVLNSTRIPALHSAATTIRLPSSHVTSNMNIRRNRKRRWRPTSSMSWYIFYNSVPVFRHYGQEHSRQRL